MRAPRLKCGSERKKYRRSASAPKRIERNRGAARGEARKRRRPRPCFYLEAVISGVVHHQALTQHKMKMACLQKHMKCGASRRVVLKPWSSSGKKAGTSNRVIVREIRKSYPAQLRVSCRSRSAKSFSRRGAHVIREIISSSIIKHVAGVCIRRGGEINSPAAQIYYARFIDKQ